MKPIFLANWKMNMLPAEAETFCKSFLGLVQADASYTDIGIAAPYTSIAAVKAALGGKKGIWLGAQNCHWADNGAFTGEISAKMLKDMGCDFVIVGHSERRQYFGETNDTVSKRALKTIENGLRAVVCIGETEAQYKAGITNQVVLEQLKGSLAGISADMTKDVLLAYEPVWAIGTGLTATPEIAASVHALIRSELINMYGNVVADHLPILYGGSTKPDNIAGLCAMPNINGGLVGGASLQADSFAKLVINGR
ncbi:MAG: triose-phosphate isomerase [Deltaproteobacteria bacterium]|nr:triose-phosphate isomerase [Deltaproteobacteria bacterium]